MGRQATVVLYVLALVAVVVVSGRPVLQAPFLGAVDGECRDRPGVHGVLSEIPAAFMNEGVLAGFRDLAGSHWNASVLGRTAHNFHDDGEVIHPAQLAVGMSSAEPFVGESNSLLRPISVQPYRTRLRTSPCRSPGLLSSDLVDADAADVMGTRQPMSDRASSMPDF
ncbi:MULTISPECIES: hypothetical protein [unclassified Rhodococcus (in: high G+C Gram-positive bacteria)]|uniref:hypothetical protein n=1 Tax=unclassified Rhodococcus (in: high G+C Gram-positive bacteria) TaxID=192944 RepID=UPI001581ADE9|nr:hypothetical protein [Rhodococcus sp. W8901]QKT09318.1 hypothetical protein HUN07_03435 [Rhodococcus sp. W8901]